MNNKNKTKNIFGEENKEVKETKRTRSPNKTKQDKLDAIDKKIEYHMNSKKSNQDKINKLVKINNGHDAEIEKLKAKRAEVEKSPDKLSISRVLADIKAKRDRGEELTDEEMSIVFSRIK